MSNDTRASDGISEDEIALRAAINVLEDTIESKRKPSGAQLEPDATEVHRRSADRLRGMMRRFAHG